MLKFRKHHVAENGVVAGFEVSSINDLHEVRKEFRDMWEIDLSEAQVKDVKHKICMGKKVLVYASTAFIPEYRKHIIVVDF